MRASDLMELLEAFYGDDDTDGHVLVSMDGLRKRYVVNSVECDLKTNNVVLEINSNELE